MNDSRSRDQILTPFVGQRVHRLQQQDLEHQHVVEGWAAPLGPIRARHCLLQLRAEHLEIYQASNALEIITLCRQLA